MDEHKQQVAQRIKEANNILVTVSANPSVDQLAACIGITLALNKMGKHGTAVFSGEVPSILEFLHPEETIEKNTDSLRDFIIALDKSKADKLRYKVEDRVVKIFITPYRTSISDKDFEFSQGDFNVDVVLALGVQNQADLDKAITAHGRILHDATVIALNNQPGGQLGNINWLNPAASSLCELGMELLEALDNNVLDEQIATAMLTGIVAETERFSNVKTTPRTMSISAELMAAGANQQLVATKLEESATEPEPAPSEPITEVAPEAAAATDTLAVQSQTPPAVNKPTSDGTLIISHDEPAKPQELSMPEPEEVVDPNTPPQIHIDDQGSIKQLGQESAKDKKPPTISRHAESPRMILEPPTLGGQLTASGTSDTFELLPSDPLAAAKDKDRSDASEVSPIAPTIMPLSDSSGNSARATEGVGSQSVLSAGSDSLSPFTAGKTLSQIEQDVNSSHISAPATPDVARPFAAPGSFPNSVGHDQAASLAAQPVAPTIVDPTVPSGHTNTQNTLQNARDLVAQAIDGTSQPLPPVQALNAQHIDLTSPVEASQSAPPVFGVANSPAPAEPPVSVAPNIAPYQPAYVTQPAAQQLSPPAPAMPGGSVAPISGNPATPPPVPPPMMPPVFQ